MEKQEVSVKKNILWNSIGTFVMFFCQWLMMVLVVRLSGYADSGILSLSISCGNVFLIIAAFGVKTYQVSDVKGKYQAGQYYAAKIFSIILTLVIAGIFVLVSSYEGVEKTTIILYALYIMVYSYSDAIYGELQKKWRLDIAGYGRSGAVEDGLAVDTAYAAEDIHSAIEKIVQVTGQDRIDLLGWSWGTMTCSLCAAKYPEHLRRLILYAPILSGIGEGKVSEPFSHNTWESAAEDFQKNRDGTFDSDVTDPVLIELFCSNCWHYDGDFSPNGWQKDARKDRDTQLIDLDAIRLETLVICGDNDPNLNYDLIRSSVTHLPEGSELCVIPGGSHIVMYERKGYHAFQDRIVLFLNKG